MPWPVYSERLMSANNAVGMHYVAIPDGKRFVLTDVAAVNPLQVAGQIQVHAGGLPVLIHTFPAQDRAFHMACRIPIYQGELAGVYIELTSYTVTLSGYMLEDPTGATGPGLEQGHFALKHPEQLPARWHVPS